MGFHACIQVYEFTIRHRRDLVRWRNGVCAGGWWWGGGFYHLWRAASCARIVHRQLENHNRAETGTRPRHHTRKQNQSCDGQRGQNLQRNALVGSNQRLATDARPFLCFSFGSAASNPDQMEFRFRRSRHFSRSGAIASATRNGETVGCARARLLANATHSTASFGTWSRAPWTKDDSRNGGRGHAFHRDDTCTARK